MFRVTADDGAQAAKFVPKAPGADREMLLAELDGVQPGPCHRLR